ncbi:probable E3 ubiquitin-protein ligase HERC4 [Bacillus rossius redtenbacheri]|uniref:probable E3 ubiquitin-protein ligase HERC4 n=1 Tax=Bacillus rossius redtenbacheri TaxID=93214 RepID=UPI002FDCD09D
MLCWGNSVNGELGLGGIEEEQIFSPRELKFVKATEIKQVACGSHHTALLTSGGELYTCGNNDYGQLGHNKACKKPEHVSSLEAYSIAAVACGGAHTLALNEWGQLFSWGSNHSGQLGAGSGEVSDTPRIVKTIASCCVVQVACGLNHSLALTNKGELFAWGCNRYGQLGLNSSSSETRPRLVKALAGVPLALVACGSNHSFAVSKSGAVFGWGKNEYGQVGTGDNRNKPVPFLLNTLRSCRVKYVACGEDFSVFLTKDGGVFTCGAGMYGKLGHGSYNNELLPRKISELMGSTITQVACGRHHTVALMPSQGRVYAFGLGGVGQLGSQGTASCATPRAVHGPWVSPSAPADADAPVVRRLYAGGDQCFAAVTRLQERVPPEDCRLHPPGSQVWCISLDSLQKCCGVPVDTPVDQDLLSYLETVFGSLACLNSSFLLPGDEHYCCSGECPGVRIADAEQAFTAISRIEHDTLKSVIMNCIVQSILPSLVPSPPDHEAMRAYLTLPLYHEFDNARHCEHLQNPFGAALLNLKSEAAKIIDSWWRIVATDNFERLIRIYKDVLTHMILQAKPSNGRVNSVHLGAKLRVPLEVLKRLNRHNYSVDGLRVPYDRFCVPELISLVEIEIDYINWLMNNQRLPGTILFCDYPFLFDAETKTVILRTDQSIQRSKAMNEAAANAVLRPMFFSAPPARGTEIFCELYVDRSNIVQDAVRELLKHDTSDLKKPLKVHFLGEEADDAGGVTKEFFLLLLREILDPKYGMFCSYEEQRTIWFNEFSFEDQVMYCLVGLVCGLTIYNFTIIDLPFPLALYKKLLDFPVGLRDLQGLSPALAKSLQDVLDYEGDDLEDVFCLTFQVNREVFGEVRSIPLKPGGGDIPVTQQNKQEFVDLYVDRLLNSGVEVQFSAFKDGFLKVCGSRVLNLFHPRELMAVVVGNENYDWVEFERNAEYRGGYSASDPTIIMFWNVFHQLSLEDKKKFLLFLTGSDRVPIQGMKELKIYIQPTTDDRCLPVAHTCFNLLDLPRYKTQEKLRYKLLQAIQQTEGFSLV